MKVLAERVLSAVRRIDPETRYEEKSYGAVLGTNAALREELQGRPGETPYPLGSGQCDLVFLHDGAEVWIEVKHSWTWAVKDRPGQSSPSRVKHLLHGDKSALFDVRSRLNQLERHPEVGAYGLLLILLDSAALPYPMQDVRRLEEQGELDKEPWMRTDLDRWSSEVPGYSSIGVRPIVYLRGSQGR